MDSSAFSSFMLPSTDDAIKDYLLFRGLVQTANVSLPPCLQRLSPALATASLFHAFQYHAFLSLSLSRRSTRSCSRTSPASSRYTHSTLFAYTHIHAHTHTHIQMQILSMLAPPFSIECPLSSFGLHALALTVRRFAFSLLTRVCRQTALLTGLCMQSAHMTSPSSSTRGRSLSAISSGTWMKARRLARPSSCRHDCTWMTR